MNTNYDLINDQTFTSSITAIHLISIVSSVLLMLVLGCIRFIIRGDRAFWKDYNIVFYLLLFMAWTYFMDSLVSLVHSSVTFPCSAFIFFKVWFSNQSTMLASAFAILLVRRFKFSFVYWLIPFSLSLALASITFAFNQSLSQVCLYGNDIQVETFALYMIPQGLCLMFNIGAILYVLITKSSSLPASYTLYSLIPLVCQLGNMIAQVTNRYDAALLWWSQISSGLGGLMISLVFLLDPLFWHGTSFLSRSIFTKNGSSNDDDDDEETTLGNKRHTMLTNQSERKSTQSNSMISFITPPAPTMKKTEKEIITNQQPRQYYQPSLSPNHRDTPIIIFPPPPPTAAPNQRHPTSLELDESDFIDMFAKPSLQVGTNFTTSTSTTATNDLPSALLSPAICYEMEDAVPWRVLEADEEEEITNDPATPETVPVILPRSSSITFNYRKESWLSLYDDDPIKEDDKINLSSSFSSSITLTSAASSPATVSDWLTRRGDSLDGMREHMGRTSKSIRRWCRNVHEPEDLASRLHVVHEEQPQ